MTNVIMDIAEDDSTLYFDCETHAGDKEVCLIMSTACNVLVLRCDKRGYDVDVCESGHVRIDIERADPETCAVARALLDLFLYLEEVYPENVKVY